MANAPSAGSPRLWKFPVLNVEIDGKAHVPSQELTLALRESRPLGSGSAWTDPSAKLGRHVIFLLYDGPRQLEELNLDLFVHGLADGRIPSYSLICHADEARIYLAFWRIKNGSEVSTPSEVTCGPSLVDPHDNHDCRFREFDIFFKVKTDYDSAKRVFAQNAKLFCQESHGRKGGSLEAKSGVGESTASSINPQSFQSLATTGQITMPRRPATDSPSLMPSKRYSPLVASLPASGRQKRAINSPRPFGPWSFQPGGGVTTLGSRSILQARQPSPCIPGVPRRQSTQDLQMADSRRLTPLSDRSFSTASSRSRVNISPLSSVSQQSVGTLLPEYQQRWSTANNDNGRSTNPLQNRNSIDSSSEQPPPRSLPFAPFHANRRNHPNDISPATPLSESVSRSSTSMTIRAAILDRSSATSDKPRKRIRRGSNPGIIASLSQPAMDVTSFSPDSLLTGSLSTGGDNSAQTPYEVVEGNYRTQSQSSQQIEFADGRTYKGLGDALLGTRIRHNSDVDAPGETDDENLAYMQVAGTTEQRVGDAPAQLFQDRGPQMTRELLRATADAAVQVNFDILPLLGILMEGYEATRDLKYALKEEAEGASEVLAHDQEENAMIEAQYASEFEARTRMMGPKIAARLKRAVSGRGF